MTEIALSAALADRYRIDIPSFSGWWPVSGCREGHDHSYRLFWLALSPRPPAHYVIRQ